MTSAMTGLPPSEGSRWRRYQEEHVLDSALLRLLAQGARGLPHRSVTGRARRLAPGSAPIVSVVIPCYNYARFLPAAVRSALGQAGVDVEIIIVDDRSTDDSAEVARRLSAAHPAVRALVNDANCGHVHSFNRGWAASTGEYVVKLDADDLLAPGALARAVALLEAYPNVGLVYGHPHHFSSPEPPGGRVATVRWDVWDGAVWLEERCRLGVSAITNPEMVLRSSLLGELGPMDPTVPFAPDMEISLRVAAVSDVGYVRGADQALHREHVNSMSETEGAGVLVDLQARDDAFRSALEKIAHRIPNVTQLDELARRALARDALRFASAAQDARGEWGASVSLLEFAERTYPESSSWLSFQALSSRASARRVGRLGAAVRRLRRRVRDESYHLRWTVFGV